MSHTFGLVVYVSPTDREFKTIITFDNNVATDQSCWLSFKCFSLLCFQTVHFKDRLANDPSDASLSQRCARSLCRTSHSDTVFPPCGSVCAVSGCWTEWTSCRRCCSHTSSPLCELTCVTWDYWDCWTFYHTVHRRTVSPPCGCSCDTWDWPCSGTSCRKRRKPAAAPASSPCGSSCGSEARWRGRSACRTSRRRTASLPCGSACGASARSGDCNLCRKPHRWKVFLPCVCSGDFWGRSHRCIQGRAHRSSLLFACESPGEWSRMRMRRNSRRTFHRQNLCLLNVDSRDLPNAVCTQRSLDKESRQMSSLGHNTCAAEAPAHWKTGSHTVCSCGCLVSSGCADACVSRMCTCKQTLSRSLSIYKASLRCDVLNVQWVPGVQKNACRTRSKGEVWCGLGSVCPLNTWEQRFCHKKDIWTTLWSSFLLWM